LGAPGSSYASAYASAQAKLDLAVRCRAALCQQPSAPAEDVQQQVLTGQYLGGSSSSHYTLQQLQVEVPFLLGQMTALQQSGVFTPIGGAARASMPFLDWLRRSAAAAAAQADGPAAKRQRISEAGSAAAGGGAGAAAAAAGGSGGVAGRHLLAAACMQCVVARLHASRAVCDSAAGTWHCPPPGVAGACRRRQ
jgi:hypothetical protein